MKKSTAAVFINLSLGYWGGAERRLARICDYLINTIDNPNAFIILRGSEESIKAFSTDYFTQNSLGRIIGVSSTLSVMNVVKNLRPELFHFIDCSGRFLPIYLTANRISGNLVMDVASFYLASGVYNSFLHKRAVYTVLRMCKAVTLLYPSKEAQFQKTIDAVGSSAKLKVAPNSFTDVDSFYPASIKQNLVVFSGRLEEYKQPMLLLHAVLKNHDLLRKQGFRVVFCGEGSEKSKMVNFIETNRLADVVEVAGFVKAQEFVNKSKIFFSIQKDDNYPSQALMEAISAGNYVVATNVGDTFRMVNSEFAKLVEPTSHDLSEALKEAISLVSTNETFEAIVSAARDFALSNFHIKKMAEHYNNLWLEVLGDNL